MLSLIPVDFDPFAEQREIEKITFTNDSQREIWLSCIIGGDDANLSYNESVSLKITGDLDFGAFKKAADGLVLRHEALRATVSADGETLIIYKHADIDLQLQDVSALSEAEISHVLETFLHHQMGTVLDLKEGPLFKLFLHKIGRNDYYFTIIKHHIIGDGWSTGIILEDLSKLYNGYVKGDEVLLPPANQISDYESAQAAFKTTQAYKQTQDYWLKLYEGNIPVLDLPVDNPRTSPRTYKGNRIDSPLSNDTVAQLKAIGIKAGASLVTTLLAAFEVFLFQKTQQNNIVVGLPSSGQAASGLNDVVGHCVNLLPLKSEINPGLSFTDYLKKRKTEVLDAYEHQRITFGEIIKQLYVQRDASRVTLVPVMFNIDMGMDNAVAFTNLNFKLISNPRAYEHFELYLNATGSAEGLMLEWSYNTGLFNDETISNFNIGYQKILTEIIAQPSVIVNELVDNKHTETPFTNGSPLSIPDSQTINSLIDTAISKNADKVALKFNNEVITYSELNNKINRFTAFLIENGIGVGDIVALSADRCADMVICLLAILKAGAAYLPLDPEYPLERIEFMLTDSSAKLLLTSKNYKERYQSPAREVVIDDVFLQLGNYQPLLTSKPITGSNLAYILYTSGSTGKPKGVKITHLNLVNFLLSMQVKPGIQHTDRLLAITTISFDIAGLELYLPLITGAELIIADAEAVKDGRLLINLIETYNISMMQATPSTWQMMLDSGWQKRYNLKILSGGEALPPDLANRLLNHCTELWNMYGPTETTIWSAIKQISPQGGILTVGSPIHNTQIYIMDKFGNPESANQTGEIYIGGKGVAQGYLNRPELTAEKFIDDVFTGIPGSKLYRTGDLGKILTNGEVVCLGRIDQQVKIRGHRIELGEIETVIDRLKGVKQTVVTASGDLPVNKRLIAYVTLNDEIADAGHSPSWKDRWESLYHMGADGKNKEQNIDGALLQQLENSDDLNLQLAEWLQTSVTRIKELNAKRIYEIGSGAGQILFELASGLDYYMATDYAETAINSINERLAARPLQLPHVSAHTAAADDFSALAGNPVDLVLIHSVAQYFSDANYLLAVIKQSVEAVKRGGCVFIGDMQGKSSLQMFHAMDYLPRSPDSATVGSFSEVVANRVRIEEELTADPAFFYSLPKLFPEITGVDIQLRKGHYLNETTKYHYDVWLYVNKPVNIATADRVKNWADINTMANLSSLLKNSPGMVVNVNNVINQRTVKDCRLLNLINSTRADASIAWVKSEVEKVPQGIDPDLFWELGNEAGFNVHIRWASNGTDGLFDATFIPVSSSLTLPQYPAKELLKGDIQSFVRAPLFKNQLWLSKELIQNWKNVIAEQLPLYMVPDEFIVLKSFPLTPNLKIDRKALPKPEPKKSTDHTGDTVTLTAEELLIADIWTETLGLDNLKPTDDFFELGGHSLLAVKVMVAIENKTGKRLPIATLFNHSTISKLAKQLVVNSPTQKWDALVPIKTTGSKTPVFLIHGGGLNILLFKSISDYFDDEQPVYGIHALGLNHETEIPLTIPEIAARYIKDILQVRPKGPYALGGYSLGGFIAFEMASQLKALGNEISFLGVMDTYAGNSDATGSNISRIGKKILRQFYKIPFIVKSFIAHPAETFSYQIQVFEKKINSIFASETLVPKDTFTDYEAEIYKKYSDALDKYTLTPADIAITLFRVEKRLYYLDDPVYLGWTKYALKGVSVKEVPGDHKTFLYPPNSEKFAQIIQQVLDK